VALCGEEAAKLFVIVARPPPGAPSAGFWLSILKLKTTHP